jgi:TIR domain
MQGWREIVKVFLSYGHDCNAPLVDRISRDLEAARHEVWIDKSEIKAGEHWRRSIVDGLRSTDWVLAFLSRNSVRDPGVCLDEISIALHAKGGAIATVLVESDAKVDPPVSVSHIQWLDMRDWSEFEAKGGLEWEAWYKNKLGEILALLASPDVKRFAGEIKELDGLLAPRRFCRPEMVAAPSR